ncbi:MAG: polysaccharide biosynthesis tyrosine autokinase [Chloroflexi bacterium]|nr:polysaccharide biosynthesis tyrosine autokinase [Chloroflexota bacterium]
MDPIGFSQTLLRRWWLVLLLGLAGVAIAYYFESTTPTRYQSTVSLQLNPAANSSFLPYSADSGVSPSSPVVAQAASYQEVLRSRAFGAIVVQQLGLNLPPDAIGGAISTQLVPNTNILHLSVTWDNPTDAQQLAQHIAEVFIAENQRRQQSQPGIQAQLAEMQQSASDTQSRIAPLQDQRDKLDDAVAHGDLSRLSELTGLDQRLSGLESSHTNLLVEISRIQSSFETAVILDSATPGRPIDALPLVQAVVFGLLGGIGVAVTLIVVLEHLTDVVRTPSDAINLTGLPLLGRLRHARRRMWPLPRRRHHRALVMADANISPAAEAIRSLRIALQLIAPPWGLQTLVVTSGVEGEGKTFVAGNLAIAQAQAGRRVVLVDGNLRRPALHRWFGVSNTSGFSDALALARHRNGEIDGEIAGVTASGIDNLWILPAGTLAGRSSDLFDTESIANVLQRLERDWDSVIVDSAHVGSLADTLLLAHEAHGSVLVARAGRTRRATLRSALAALNTIPQPVLGVVLNDEHRDLLSRFDREDYFQYTYVNEERFAPAAASSMGNQSLPESTHHNGTHEAQSEGVHHAGN